MDADPCVSWAKLPDSCSNTSARAASLPVHLFPVLSFFKCVRIKGTNFVIRKKINVMKNSKALGLFGLSQGCVEG